METEKLYSPLEFYFHDPAEKEASGDYGSEYDLYDVRYRIAGIEASEFVDEIDLAIRRDRDRLDKVRGMAEYLPEKLQDKIHSMFPSIEFHGNELYCVTAIELKESLTADEMATLKDHWSGQLSDGWGEGFEQREINVEGNCELYIRPWTHDGNVFFIDTQREFNARLGLEMPEIIEDLRAELTARAEKNWEDYRHAPRNITPDNIFHVSVAVIAHRDAYIFLNEYADFSAEQFECLLQFADPVDLVAAYLDPSSDIAELPGILSDILENQEEFKGMYALAEPSEPPLIEAKLYSPMFVDLWVDSDVYHDFPEDVSQQDAVLYSKQISAAVFAHRLPEETERGLMAYYDEPDSVGEKVRSIFIGVEVHDSKLWTVTTLEMTEPLSQAEFAAVHDYINGQLADGWGGSLAQQSIRVDGGEINVRLWDFRDKFFIDTQEQFSQRVGVALPADALSQLAEPEKAQKVGEKPSTLDEIRQAAKDARERLAAPKKDTPGRNNSEPDL